MNQTVTAYFSNAGTSATGLSPTIRIRNVASKALIIMDEAMTEVGDGWYKYVFSNYVIGTDYVIRCDGTATLSGADRYVVASSAGETDLIRKILMNKLHLADGIAGNWVLYDDDGSTPLLTFDVTDKDNNEISQPKYSPSKRSKGT